VLVLIGLRSLFTVTEGKSCTPNGLAWGPSFGDVEYENTEEALISKNISLAVEM
jgi:hypothetical protein